MIFDVYNDDFYKRLDLDESSTKDEIKRNFFQSVRLYPPEKKPEEHKLIREAYDILENEQSRGEYDTRKKYGKEIEHLETQLKIAQENEDTGRIESLLKKIIIIAPKIYMYRNKLGVLYLHDEQPEKAKRQFKKAVEHNPTNILYLLNLGHTEEKLENISEAERCFRKAWDLDLEDYAAPRALASLLYHSEQKTEAYKVLDKAIMEDGVIDFQDFFCIFDKLNYLFFDNNTTELDNQLKLIEEISKKDDEKEFASFMLMDVCTLLTRNEHFEVALKFSTVALKLKENEAVRKLKFVLEEYKDFNSNDGIKDDVKNPVRFYFLSYIGNIPDDKFEDLSNGIRENLNFLQNTTPINIEFTRNLKFIKNEYPHIYQLQGSFYDQFLEVPLYALNHMEKCPYCFKDFNIKLRSESKPSSFDDMIRNLEFFDPIGDYNCPHCGKSVKYNGKQFSKNAICYITTATLNSMGGGDNSLELMTMRSFRDNWLMEQVDGCRLIDEYYETAPLIVKSIDEQSNQQEIYKSIWKNYLNDCYQCITRKEYYKAKLIYIEMVTNLKKKYLIEELVY